jgi:hypothetical protein
VLEAALAGAPHRLDLRLKLAEALYDADRIAEARDVIAPAASSANGDGQASYWYGRSVSALGDYEGAIPALQRATTLDVRPAFGELAHALLHAGREQEALAAAFAGLERTAECARSLTTAARVLGAHGKTQELLDLCRGLRVRARLLTRIVAVEAVTAALLGRHADVAALVDREAWFADVDLSLGDQFNDRLANEILSHSALQPTHSSYATWGDNARVRTLTTVGGPEAQRLLDAVRERVTAYVRGRSELAGHPMLAHVPNAVNLSAWALVLSGDGHERWHLHDWGWISGVYYVKVPNSDAEGAGAIGFGPLRLADEGLTDGSAFPRWTVQPNAGKLLLFPSYFVHRTWPTATPEPRISVAFDVIPVH